MVLLKVIRGEREGVARGCLAMKKRQEMVKEMRNGKTVKGDETLGLISEGLILLHVNLPEFI